MLIRGLDESQADWDARLHQYRLSIGYYGDQYDYDQDTDDQLDSGHGRDISGEGPDGYTEDGTPIYSVETELDTTGSGLSDRQLSGHDPVRYDDGIPVFYAEGTAMAPGMQAIYEQANAARRPGESNTHHNPYVQRDQPGPGIDPNMRGQITTPIEEILAMIEAGGGSVPNLTTPESPAGGGGGGDITSKLLDILGSLAGGRGTVLNNNGGQGGGGGQGGEGGSVSLDKVLDMIIRIGGATSTVNNTVTGIRQFGMTDGEKAADYFEDAFPGTTPWERLGTPSQVTRPQESQALQAHEAMKAQLINNTRNTIITAWGQAAGKMIDAGMSPEEISKLTPQINGLMKQLGLPTNDMAGNRPFGPENTPKGSLMKQQMKEITAQMNRWNQMTSIEEKRASIEELRAHIAYADTLIKKGDLEAQLAQLPILKQQADAATTQAAASLKQAEAAQSQALTAGRQLAINDKMAGIQQQLANIKSGELELGVTKATMELGHLKLAGILAKLDVDSRKQVDWTIDQLESQIEEKGVIDLVGYKILENADVLSVLAVIASLWGPVGRLLGGALQKGATAARSAQAAKATAAAKRSLRVNKAKISNRLNEWWDHQKWKLRNPKGRQLSLDDQWED